MNTLQFGRHCLPNSAMLEKDRHCLTNCPQQQLRISRPKTGRHRLPNPKDRSQLIFGVIQVSEYITKLPSKEVLEERLKIYSQLLREQ